MLAILVHDLSATGVVRNAIRIAAHMADTGIATELWVMRAEGAFRDQVPQGVAVIPMGRSRSRFPRRIETLLAVPAIARAIAARQPHVLLSAGNHFHLAAGLAFKKAGAPSRTRLIGRASNATPRVAPPLAAIANTLDALKYRAMDRVIAVSRELADDLETRLGIAPERITVIANGVDIEGVRRLSGAPLDDPWFGSGEPPVIVSAGRLSRQKNYALLLDGFAILRRTMPARLVILGDGPDRNALLRKAARLGIADDVRLPGFEANPHRYFARAGLFALTSRWEGASNVILEALACGCPVVAVDCPTGIREQLDHGRIGPIVPRADAAMLAKAMEKRLAAPRHGAELQAYAECFGQARMLAAYEAVIAGEINSGL